MQILKNIVIFIVSVLSISLLIIIFDQLGMNKKLNLFLSALLYGVFITIYLQKVFLSLSYFLGFYSLLFMISYSVEVIVMLFISCSVLLIIKMIMPKLKDTRVDRFFIFNKLYKKWVLMIAFYFFIQIWSYLMNLSVNVVLSCKYYKLEHFNHIK